VPDKPLIKRKKPRKKPRNKPKKLRKRANPGSLRNRKVSREEAGLEGDTPRGQTGSSATQLPMTADSAVRLLQDIKAHRIDPSTLTPTQRRSVLVLCAHGSMTSTELAVLFSTTPSTIRMDLKKIRDEYGREVREYTLSEVLGQLAFTAEKCTAKAMKQEDPGLAWSIQRDLAKMFKDLGVLDNNQGQGGFKLIIESMGSGYEKTREAMKLAMNPALTGMVEPEAPRSPVPALPVGTTIDVEAREVAAQERGEEEEFAKSQNTPAPKPPMGLAMGFE